MQSSTTEIPTIIGTALAGGFYAGRIRIDGQLYALVVAPKAEGEHKGSAWIGRYKDVPDALSYHDGAANTAAMAKAGSKLAKWAQKLAIGGFDDWYLPSQDELEVIYRNLKPTDQKNTTWNRSGININGAEPTAPYTPDLPAKTQAEAFQEGGAEAFETGWHWTSTQSSSYSISAWLQGFGHGNQDGSLKSLEARARAVRRLPI